MHVFELKEQLQVVQRNQLLILQQLGTLTSTPSTPAHSQPQEEVVGVVNVPSTNSSQAPTALPLQGVNESTSLSSSEIDKSQLRSIHQFLCHQPQTKITNAGKLTVLLARECVFGVALMRRCTPLGAGKLPGLPVRELQWLKQLMLERFPEFWGDVEQFTGRNASLHWNMAVVVSVGSNLAVCQRKTYTHSYSYYLFTYCS